MDRGLGRGRRRLTNELSPFRYLPAIAVAAAAIATWAGLRPLPPAAGYFVLAGMQLTGRLFGDRLHVRFGGLCS